MDNAVEESGTFTKALLWAVIVVSQSGPDEHYRMGEAYQEALQFSTTIENIGGSTYPRVLACFERSDAYRKANDIAWVGWLLKAAEERVKDGNLADIEKITRILARIIRMLPLPTPTLH